MELASRGASLVIASRTLDHLQPAAEEIYKATGATVVPIVCDVRDPEQVEKMISTTAESFGAIDVLINNAAGNFVVPSEKLTVNGWNAVIGIVLNGTWYCSSAVGRRMLDQGHGVILNIIATFAQSGAPGVVHSAAAKAGVLSMTRTLAAEWGHRGVRVNALAPGIMVTEGASKNLLFDSLEVQQKLAQGVPLRRLATIEEVAKLAAFLCSDDASYITGDVMTADGGRSLNTGFMELMQHHV